MYMVLCNKMKEGTVTHFLCQPNKGKKKKQKLSTFKESKTTFADLIYENSKKSRK